MKVFSFSLFVVVCGYLIGCGTDSGGVVPIGPDSYMVGGLGRMTDYSSSAVKARLYKEAANFCQQRNEVMSPLASSGIDSGYATYASAEVQFRCLKTDHAKRINIY